MEANDVNKILRKYKKCPKCGISYKNNKFKFNLEDEIITITCECGFYKQVDKNNKELIN